MHCLVPALMHAVYHRSDPSITISSSPSRPTPHLKWLLSKSEYPLDGSTSSPVDILANDWINHAIRAARFTATAGELRHFPYIKGAAGIFVSLLKQVRVGLYST